VQCYVCGMSFVRVCCPYLMNMKPAAGAQLPVAPRWPMARCPGRCARARGLCPVRAFYFRCSTVYGIYGLRLRPIYDSGAKYVRTATVWSQLRCCKISTGGDDGGGARRAGVQAPAPPRCQLWGTAALGVRPLVPASSGGLTQLARSTGGELQDSSYLNNGDV
jgi:hypothetical protein